MIGMLTGRVIDKDFSTCLLDVGGVGYEVAIPLSTFDKLPLNEEMVTLFIHTQVREDAITLFGFADKAEKELFRQLISVSGVGGKLALNVLSAMPAGNFCAAVASGDAKTLSRINGVGKRTAERLIVELKGKLTDIDPAAAILLSICGARCLHRRLERLSRTVSPAGRSSGDDAARCRRTFVRIRRKVAVGERGALPCSRLRRRDRFRHVPAAGGHDRPFHDRQ